MLQPIEARSAPDHRGSRASTALKGVAAQVAGPSGGWPLRRRLGVRELTPPVEQPMVGAEQEEIQGVPGGPEGLGHRLVLIEQIGKAPTAAIGADAPQLASGPSWGS